MKRYQIRIPNKFEVEDVIEEMATKGWDSIIHHLDAEKILVPLKNYRSFQNAVYHAVTPNLRTFALCGKPDFCAEEICMCRLDKRSKPTANSGDGIFHLFVDSDIDTFLDEVVRGGVESLESILKPGKKPATICDLHEAFERVLVHYLYYNPICGKTPFCEYSELVSTVAV